MAGSGYVGGFISVMGRGGSRSAPRHSCAFTPLQGKEKQRWGWVREAEYLGMSSFFLLP